MAGFMVSQVAGTLLAVGLIALGGLLGDWWAADLADGVVITPSGGVLGVAMPASARAPAGAVRRGLDARQFEVPVGGLGR